MRKAIGLMVLVLVLGLAVVGQGLDSAELSPFATDGCSAFPDGTFEQQALWLDCCVVHDLAYWQGGTREQRSEADEALAECVDSVGEPAIAKLMLAGVRVGGTPYLPTRFRWGYGWPFTRGYAPLTEAELEQISAALAAAGLKGPQDTPEEAPTKDETTDGNE